MTNDLMSIHNMVYTIRGQKVILDSDLARLYEVETKVLNNLIGQPKETRKIGFHTGGK